MHVLTSNASLLLQHLPSTSDSVTHKACISVSSCQHQHHLTAAAPAAPAAESASTAAPILSLSSMSLDSGI
jgi:hypothetical protein